MSVPFYYNHGPGASAQMKADVARVRKAKPKYFVPHRYVEQRMAQDGNTIAVEVQAEPRAAGLSPEDRHEFCDEIRGEPYEFGRVRHEGRQQDFTGKR